MKVKMAVGRCCCSCGTNWDRSFSDGFNPIASGWTLGSGFSNTGARLRKVNSTSAFAYRKMTVEKADTSITQSCDVWPDGFIGSAMGIYMFPKAGPAPEHHIFAWNDGFSFQYWIRHTTSTYNGFGLTPTAGDTLKIVATYVSGTTWSFDYQINGTSYHTANQAGLGQGSSFGYYDLCNGEHGVSGQVSSNPSATYHEYDNYSFTVA